MTKISMLAAALAVVAVPAFAQNAGPNAANALRMTGTVASVSGDSLSVKMDDGKTQTVKLAPNVMYMRNKPATVKDIKTNDFVASAAVKGADGKLHSTELRIFPEAMRGVGEGQRPMNDAKNQTMTNATVTGVAMVGESGDVKVKLPNMDSELVVDPGVPVTAIVAAGKDDVKAGAKVQVMGTKGDGGDTATRVTIE
jgi:hypothetical protein